MADNVNGVFASPANTYIQPYEKIEDYGKKECVRENKRSREVIL